MKTMMRAVLSLAATVLLVMTTRSDCAENTYSTSSLEAAVGVQRLEETKAIKCTGCGFSSKSSKSVLDNLLSKFDKKFIENEAVVYDNGKKFLVFNSEKINSLKSDVAFVYTHHMSLYDEEKTLLNMQLGLKSITEGEISSDSKKMLVLVVDGPQTTAEYVKSMLEEAWVTLLDKNDKNQDIMSQIVVHIIQVNGPVTAIAKESIDNIVDDESLEGKVLSSLFNNIEIVSTKISPMVDEHKGIDACKDAVTAAMRWARDTANESLVRLQKVEAANEFAPFVEKLIQGAISQMRMSVEKSGGGSETALMLAEADISRTIFSMLVPIYRRQVQLVRQEAAKAFNAAVGDELETTIFIANDLSEAKYNAMKSFTTDVKQLIPKGAPMSTWNMAFDQKQLVESLDEYIESRIDQLKIVGVLSRGRKPIDLRFDVFVPHPLGRDYRQDPLAAGNSIDEAFFDEGLTRVPTPIIHPSIVRSILESPEGKEATKSNKGWFKSSLGKKESDFAREMLMFPLSIKNPGVSLMASRQTKRKASAPPKRDSTRELLGPERFIRWDMDRLDVVKENMDEITNAKTAKRTPLVDKVLNVVPFFKKGYYNHPEVTFGNKYSAKAQIQNAKR
mmetsp:Transcript_203/g.253  ORF Transcript_203/g.253 Transcript_203/m.253 type:complete len:617 (+) Transcript_203:103-1953(+)